MKSKSKSKTFPKGTDISRIARFIKDQVSTSLVDATKERDYAFDAIREKVLVTIVKYPEGEIN